MGIEMNESQKQEKSKLDKLINQGYVFAENCPIEFAKILKLKIEEFAVNSQNEENRLRWRAIGIGYNLNIKTRLKERELELKQKKSKSFFRKRSRGLEN